MTSDGDFADNVFYSEMYDYFERVNASFSQFWFSFENESGIGKKIHELIRNNRTKTLMNRNEMSLKVCTRCLDLGFQFC